MEVVDCDDLVVIDLAPFVECPALLFHSHAIVRVDQDWDVFKRWSDERISVVREDFHGAPYSIFFAAIARLEIK